MMDEYHHCVMCIMARIGTIQLALGVGDKKGADKILNETLQWFKDTYDLKRKQQKREA